MEDVLGSVIQFIKFVRIQDYLDILIIAYVIYKGIKLIKETRAVQLIKGIIIILIVLQLSSWLQLHMINYLLQNTVQVGLIALLVVFQPELRRALEKMGRSKFGKALSFDEQATEEKINTVVTQICEAARTLSENRVGALMIVERDTKIGDIIRTGVTLNSDVSAELLINIFVPNTPLHDGAVIIRDDKIVAAACFLPLTQNEDLNIELGTRHRAAIGITENSDCAAVICSEETGKISLALEGSLTRNLTADSLSRALLKLLSPEPNQLNRKKIKLWKGLKK